MLILTIGAPLAAAGHPLTRLFMGASFGIALTLVVFAGAELFTGNNMFMTVGGLQGRVAWTRIGKLFFWCYVGNLAGSLLIAWLAANTGLLSLALFIPHPPSVTWAGFINNLVPSTLGNMVGGGIGVGALYWLTIPENARIPARSIEPAIPGTGAERLGESR